MLTPRENLHLFGHHEARDFFLKAFHSDRFFHGWILSGNDPLHCRIKAQSHADFRVIEGGEGGEIGIEPIRNLNSFMSQTTFEGGWRVVLIDGVEKLNRNAANALLKRLEEPSAKTVFFLVTCSLRSLFPTIRSRCQVLPFLPLEEDHLKAILTSQKLHLPSFFHIVQGSPGRLIRLIEGKGEELFHSLTKVLEGASIPDFIQTHMGEEGAFEIHNKATYLLDQCKRAQLDKKITLNCVLDHLKLA